MRRIVPIVLVSVAVALLPACGRGASPRSAGPASAETTGGAEAVGPEASQPDELAILGELDVAELIGVETVFAETSLEDTDAGLEAVATVQLADGEKAGEDGVFNVLAALAGAASDAAIARVDVWTPGQPDARFSQYLWDRELKRLERYEASIPAVEYAVYVPVGAEDSDVQPQGFTADRTGAVEGVDLARLRVMTAATAGWESDTP